MKLTNQKIITVLALGGLLAFSSAAMADDTNAPATPPAATPAVHHRIDFAKQLDLTADQQPKFKAALESMNQQLKELRQDASLTAEDKHAKVKTIREQTNESIKGILTPEQYEKWLTIQPGVKHPHSAPAATPAPAAQ